MATVPAETNHVAISDLKGKVDPDWCPGCGDFGVLAAVQKALIELQIPNHNVVTISGIGCSSNFPGFINTYGMHTLHGRALAVATGVKLANHELTVLVTGGDGDGFLIVTLEACLRDMQAILTRYETGEDERTVRLSDVFAHLM